MGSFRSGYEAQCSEPACSAAAMLDIFKRASRDAHDQVVGIVVAEREPDAVHAEERDGRGQRDSLIGVDQRMARE